MTDTPEPESAPPPTLVRSNRSFAPEPAMTVVLATQNRGKLAELRQLLADVPVELVAIGDVVPGYISPLEHGDTLEANALIKARAAASAAMLVAIADDSGLEVDALGGRPGVRSARFAGEGATDAENNAALLEALTEVDEPGRAARFRSVIALVDPWSEGAEPRVFEGRCEGSIARHARGGGGFGYDPLFVVASLGRTFAELGDDEKNEHSHRGKAVAALVPELRSLVEQRIEESHRIAEQGP
jgi:XTP/dITP diphosphohydrolase